MNKCLVICPTYNRPKEMCRMLDSFYKNSVCSDLILLTKEGSITKLINSVNYNNYDYISVTNDDFTYNTYRWDEILINTINKNGYGFAFGNDGTSNKTLPVTCIMSANIPRTLGWIQYPKLEHLYGDMIWQYIGKELSALYYVPSVSIEHHHYMFKKAEKSDYARTNSIDMYKKDNAIFEKWLLNEAQEDIEKLWNALEM